MCLTYSYERKFRGNKGWKILCRKGNKLQTGVGNASATACTLSNKYITDKNTFHIEYGYSHARYTPGFHIFTRKRDAMYVLELLQKSTTRYDNCEVHQVQFKEQINYGEVKWRGKTYKGTITPTVVAKQIKLIKK